MINNPGDYEAVNIEEILGIAKTLSTEVAETNEKLDSSKEKKI